MPRPHLARYARHSCWSDPGRFGADLAALPAQPALLPEIVGGIVLHPLFAPAAARAKPGAELRRIADIVDAILAADGRALDQPREPEERLLASCRTYALLACAILRQHGCPARVRVGFADYFTPGFAEDHWVCEYREGDAWRRLDAELSEGIRRSFAVSFLATDVPGERFVAAGPAWIKMRRGEGDPARFGVSALGLSGLWFAAGSLLRDLAALDMEEMMPWDLWGPARDFLPGTEISADRVHRLDALAEALAALDETDADPGPILADHAWAALEKSVLSFPQGQPIEVSVA
jgi:hypothetical protein